jgi:hypothetical protein
MKVEINNFMGARRFVGEAHPIFLIAGKNYQGKSSALRGIAAALTGEPLPLGLKKNEASRLVTRGEPLLASVLIEGEKGIVRVDYPSAEVQSEGEHPPRATAVAAGTLSPVVDMGAKELIAYIRKTLNAEPTFADLSSALTPALDEKTIKALWAQIERDGWDAAYQKAVEKGRELKGQWAYVTGETYGAKKADTWLPEDMTNANGDILAKDAARAREALEKAIAENALSADAREKLKNKALDLEYLRKEYDEAKNALGVLEQSTKNAIKEANKATENLPPVFETVLPCPKCDAPIGVKNGVFTLLTGDMGSAAEREKARTVYAKYEARVNACLLEEELLNERLKKLEAAGKEAAAAQKELDEADAASSPHGEDVNQKREALAYAEKRLAAYKKWSEAKVLHNKITANQQVVEVLDDRGLRSEVTLRGLSQYNKKLSDVSALCKWGNVRLSEDYWFYYYPGSAGFQPASGSGSGEFPYALISASEQYRVRATLQIAAALLDGSDAVVIDALDVLDNEGRKNLLMALAGLKLTSFVGVTLNSPDKAPNLAGIGAGQVYWMQDGYVTDIYSRKN